MELKKNCAEVYFPIDDFVVGKSVYKLCSIVMHSGTMDSGHYTAACRNLQNNEYVIFINYCFFIYVIFFRFYEFNDEYVRPTAVNTTETRSKAFAFFYSRK